MVSVRSLAVLAAALPQVLAGAVPEVQKRDSAASVLSSVAASLKSSQPASDVNGMLAAIQANAAKINQAVGSGKRADRNQLACFISKVLFPGGYVDQSSPNYTAEEDVNWSTNCWLPAACFVSLDNTVQVAIAIKVVTLTGATFAVRGAGHQQNPGFASTSGGVLLDMGRFTSLKFAPTGQSILQAGPAATWGDVYAFLDPYGLSAIGGRLPPIGVAGLILNGGLGYFPDLYGWACDNVQNFEVVLSSGFVVQANANSYPDLYKAIKGGANNFGIITRFDLYTRPVRDIWYTLQAYSAANYKSFFAAVAQSQQLLEGDAKGAFLIQGTGTTFLAGFWYAAPSADIPSVFQPFFTTVQPLAAVIPPTTGTVNSLTQALGKMPDPPESHYLAAAATAVDVNAYTEAWEAYLAKANNISAAAAGTTTSFGFSHAGSRLATAGQATGGNSLGLRAIPQLLVSVKANYLVTSTGAAVAGAVDSALASIRTAYQNHGTLQSFIFQGEAAANENVLAGSGQLGALRAASKKYDPQQYFQNLQQGGFLVKNA